MNTGNDAPRSLIPPVMLYHAGTSYWDAVTTRITYTIVAASIIVWGLLLANVGAY